MCPSTPATRRRGWPPCWPTRGCRWCSSSRRCQRGWRRSPGGAGGARRRARQAPRRGGGRLVMAGAGGRQDRAYLVETIEREGITTLHFVPSMLQVFLEERELSRCTSLRRVMASGEALPPELERRFRARLGGPL